MGTFYNRQDMTASCSPVTVGDEFEFNGRNCRVTKLHKKYFSYEYVNPTLNNGKSKIITFRYWQDNKSQKFKGGKIVLKGDKIMPWNTPELIAERKLKQLKERILIALL